MQSRTRIITDSSAQFTSHNKPGQNLIEIIPYQQHSVLSEGTTEPDRGSFQFTTPSIQEIQIGINRLGQSSSEIVILTPPKSLTAFYDNVNRAIEKVNGKMNIRVICTPTISSGLGYLAAEAAKNAASGANASQITHSINALSDKVYSLIATSNLTYYSHSGLLDPVQGVLGDHLGVIPLLLLDSDRVFPIQKLRNARHFTDYLLDFLSEFQDLSRIDLIFGENIFPESSEQYIINKIRNVCRLTQVNTLQQSPALTRLIGPKSLSVIAFEI